VAEEWGEDSVQDGTDQVLDGVGRVVEQDRADGSKAQTGARAEIPTQARSGAQADAGTAGFRGDCLCASHRLPVEGSTQGVRQRQRRARVFPALAAGRLFPEDLEGRLGRVRRDGGYRLALAERGWGFRQGAAGPRVRWPELHR
jgi:hypothetical protein